MPTVRDDLWSLVKGKPQIDPQDLADAVEAQAAEADTDFRTRLLIRDSLAALQKYWGESRWKEWLGRSGIGERLEEILRDDLGETRFTIRERLMTKTDPDDLRQFLRELGGGLHRRLQLYIGGSACLLLPGHLSRATDDIDVVDEVPSELRTQYKLLEELKSRYGLRIAHFQSHFLPDGWKNRVHSQGLFGNLEVYLVDVYDVFVSKLFSKRTKDLDDLRALAPQLDKADIVNRLRVHGGRLRADASLCPHAEKNWYVLFGEPLPS